MFRNKVNAARLRLDFKRGEASQAYGQNQVVHLGNALRGLTLHSSCQECLSVEKLSVTAQPSLQGSQSARSLPRDASDADPIAWHSADEFLATTRRQSRLLRTPDENVESLMPTASGLELPPPRKRTTRRQRPVANQEESFDKHRLSLSSV